MVTIRRSSVIAIVSAGVLAGTALAAAPSRAEPPVLPPGSVRIENVGNAENLATEGAPQPGAAVITFTPNGRPDQHWRLRPLLDGFVTIVSEPRPGLCVTDDSPIGDIHLAKCAGRRAQVWASIPERDGVRFQSGLYHGRFLAAGDDNGPVRLLPDDPNDDYQQWTLRSK